MLGKSPVRMGNEGFEYLAGEFSQNSQNLG